MDGQITGACPVQHLLIKGLVGVAYIHHKHDADQGIAIRQVMVHRALPVFLSLFACFCVA